MISSTNITSTSGVTLISAIAARRDRLPRREEEDSPIPIIEFRAPIRAHGPR
jgi:hypothetical protein